MFVHMQFLGPLKEVNNKMQTCNTNDVSDDISDVESSGSVATFPSHMDSSVASEMSAGSIVVPQSIGAQLVEAHSFMTAERNHSSMIPQSAVVQSNEANSSLTIEINRSTRIAPQSAGVQLDVADTSLTGEMNRSVRIAPQSAGVQLDVADTSLTGEINRSSRIAPQPAGVQSDEANNTQTQANVFSRTFTSRPQPVCGNSGRSVVIILTVCFMSCLNKWFTMATRNK